MTQPASNKAVVRAKCPVCNGVPVRPDIKGCAGCFECDFTGTLEQYEITQRFNEEAHQAAAAALRSRGPGER